MKRIVTTSLIAILILLSLTMIPTPVVPVSSDATPTSVHPRREGSPAQGEDPTLVLPVTEDEPVYEFFPDTNYKSNTFKGGLFVGKSIGGNISRSWLKFNLSTVPTEFGFTEARLRLHLNEEWNASADEPIAVYTTSNDSWSDDKITWANAPDFDTDPLDVIDGPAAPDMFKAKNWYEWDITQAVREAISTDKILTLVVALADEASASTECWKYFTEKEYDSFNASQIVLTYNTASATDLAVDGRHTGETAIDYVQDTTPTFSWDFTDDDPSDQQTGYEVELWDNEYFNGTRLWHSESQTETVAVSTATSGGSNYHPFGVHDEIRLQMKIPSTLVPRNGVVDRIYFGAADMGTAVLKDLVVTMATVPSDDPLTTDFEANFETANPVVVLNRETYEVSVLDGKLAIDLENRFWVSNRSALLIEVRLTNNTGDIIKLERSNTGPGTVAGIAGTGAYTTHTASYAVDRTYVMWFEYSTTDVLMRSTNSNVFPFGTAVGCSGIVQMKYDRSLFDGTGIIDRLYFDSVYSTGNVTFENFTVSLLETPLEGPLQNDSAANYGGATPVKVIDQHFYTIHNIGHAVVLDVENIFEYTGTHDLLVEIKWDALVSGRMTIRTITTDKASRYWDVYILPSIRVIGNDSLGYSMSVEFEHVETSVTYTGTPLTNSTSYAWRVRVRDTSGIWSDWVTQSFRVFIVPGPEWEGPVADPNPVTVGETVTVTINVTHSLGINAVYIEFDGANHTMSGSGDTYTYSWEPDAAGTISYTIYMESNAGTWSTVHGSIQVNEATGIIPTSGIADWVKNNVLIVAAVIGVLIVIIIIVKKRK